jgi:hypothetical protein
VSLADSGIVMLAMAISGSSDSAEAIWGEWQSDLNTENPQERSHAGKSEETHINSNATVPTNMRFIFTELLFYSIINSTAPISEHTNL